MSKWIDEQIKAYENAAKTYPILRSCGDRWEVLEALKKAEEALKAIQSKSVSSILTRSKDLDDWIDDMQEISSAAEDPLKTIEDLGKE